jgi:hypothetical protein
MMKIFPLMIAMMILSFPFVLAADLDVVKADVEPAVIVGIERPASYIFHITNNGPSDMFQIYTLIAAFITPAEMFQIQSGNTSQIEVLLHPHPETKRAYRGSFVLEYEIKGQNSGIFRDRLGFKIVEINDAISVNVENINPDDETVTFHIKNMERFRFENLSVEISSQFFDFSRTFDLSHNESRTFSAPLKKDSIRKLKADTYKIETSLASEGAQGKATEIEIRYLEREGFSVATDSSGTIIRKKTLAKTNEGNTPAVAGITESKDVLSRLFTTFSERPHDVQRKGLIVHYSWEKEIDPAESYSVTTRTNYTFPFGFLLFVVAVAVAARRTMNTSVIVSKRVSYMKTKGGEFALRVRVSVRSRKNVEDVHLTDKLPPMVKLYEKISVKPDKIDERTRRISWNLHRLNAGEERTFTYIIYSKIKVVGKFEIPSATATFKKDGKHNSVRSNKTSFVAESIDRED